MICSHANCGKRAITDDQFLSCLMCDKVAHINCIGVSGLVLDACIAKVGVRWFCQECDKTVVDFLQVRSTALQNLSSIEKELKVAQNKIAESMKDLKSFGISSLKKRKIPKNTKNVPSTETPCTSSEVIQVLDSPNATIIEKVRIESPKTRGKGSIFDISISEDSSSPKTLVAVSPKKKRKCIFVSRLSPKSTVADVNHYLKSNFKDLGDVSVKKFEFSYPRHVASFKITLSENVFHEIVDAKFWPPNTLVREFDFKPKSAPIVAELPISQPNISAGVSKN